MCGLGCKVMETGLLKSTGTYMMIPCTQDARPEASRFMSLCWVLTYLWLFLCHALPLECECLLCHCALKVFEFSIL